MSKASYTGTTNDLGVSQNSENGSKFVKLKSGLKVDITAKKHNGLLTEIIFVGNNNFVICKIGDVVCKGKIIEPVTGASYFLEGSWQENKKRPGEWQFAFSKFEAKVDEERGLVQYLAKEAPGVGPKHAASLVALHGFKIMEILKSDCEVVEGVSANVRKQLREWAKKEDTNSGIKERLYSIGITTGQVSKLLSHYGHRAEEKIRQDCFGMTEIHGFGYKTVSAIADLIGIPASDPGRIRAAIVYAADTIMDDGGHVCVPCVRIVEEACGLLSLKQDAVLGVLVEMLKEGEYLIGEDVKFKEYVYKHGIVLA